MTPSRGGCCNRERQGEGPPLGASAADWEDRLDDKDVCVTTVTGSAQGIGRATAELFIAEGARGFRKTPWTG